MGESTRIDSTPATQRLVARSADSDCISATQLAAFVSQALSAGEIAAIENHLENCTACRAVLAAAMTVMTAGPRPGRAPGAADGETLEPGDCVDRYVLGPLIGYGGMGLVYSARDPALHRDVALKVLRKRSELDDVQTIASRMRREAQVMASLSHPNVVAVFDVGTTGDRVWIAMEKVEGGTLREWLKVPRRWREIVTMFVQAGRGLAAAHDAGIVHRDFKPENVLVGTDGRARVADFGLAHLATGASDDLSTAAPAFCVQSGNARDSRRDLLAGAITEDHTLLGTPRYMAPEQLQLARASARSGGFAYATTSNTDQFSFCVSLHEALYGEPPFAGNNLLALFENVRAGRVRTPAAARSLPRHLRRALERGLSLKPGDRFESMHVLLAALDNASRARAQRIAIGAGALGLAVAAVGAVELLARRPVLCPSAAPELVGVWDDARKNQAEHAFHAIGKPYADEAFRRTARALDAYASDWLTMRRDACAAALVHGEQSGELMDLRMQCLNERFASLRALATELVRADDEIALHAVEAAGVLAPIAGCADIASLRAPVRLPSSPTERQRIAALRAQAAAASAIGPAKPADALALARSTAAAAKEVAFRPLQAEALDVEGRLLTTTGAYKEATDVLEEAVLAAEAGNDIARETDSWIDLVDALAHDGRYSDAEDAVRHAEACLEREPRSSAKRAHLLGVEAWTAGERARYGDERDLAARGLSILQSDRVDDGPEAASLLEDLSDAAVHLDDLDAAESYTRRALDTRVELFGPTSILVASSLNDLGNVLLFREDLDDAEVAYRRSLNIASEVFGADSLKVTIPLGNIAQVLSWQNRHDEAVASAKRVVELRERDVREGHPLLADAYLGLTDTEVRAHLFDQAIGDAERCVRLREAATNADDPWLASPLTMLGAALVGKGEARRAVPVLERALLLAEQRQGDADHLAEARATLGVALLTLRRDERRARKLVDQARDYYISRGAGTRIELAELDADLAALPLMAAAP
jgi:tetratricopeptide (TPR) repeat protein